MYLFAKMVTEEKYLKLSLLFALTIPTDRHKSEPCFPYLLSPFPGSSSENTPAALDTSTAKTGAGLDSPSVCTGEGLPLHLGRWAAQQV
ncbi:hypothetical protein MC885_000908 [Smutsia gigantea]|nr:hypothetical protein MC885_000908 [Smutsia gigantea]